MVAAIPSLCEVSQTLLQIELHVEACCGSSSLRNESLHELKALANMYHTLQTLNSLTVLETGCWKEVGGPHIR